ncbi:MAG: hypothetical protein MJ172_12010 [Clostridia bacterium]|nr:hypothetical protein [Clostridia bacterium]
MDFNQACEYAFNVFENGIMTIHEYENAYMFFENGYGAFSQISLLISKDDSFVPIDICEKSQIRQHIKQFAPYKVMEVPKKYSF